MVFIDKKMFSAIRCVATRMADQIFYHQSHPLPPFPACEIVSIPIKADTGSGDNFDLLQVRAQFTPGSKTIWFTELPFRNESYQDVKIPHGDIQYYFEHLLAHEACHALQFGQDPCLFANGQPGHVASELGKTASHTNSAEDYLKYVEHSLELEAHSVQLAVQVYQTYPGIGEDDFKMLCGSTPLYSHISQKGTLVNCEQGVVRLTSLLQTLTNKAWHAYEKLR